MFQQRTAGTIFNLPTDIALFILPLSIPIAISWLGWRTPSFWLFAAFMSVKLLLDSAHLSATLYAAVHRAQTGQISRWLVYSSPLVMLTLGTLLIKIDPRIFFGVLAYWSLIHFQRQQHGFVMIARAKAKEVSETRWLDAGLALNLVQYPLVYLHYSPLRMNRFMGGPFLLQVSDEGMILSSTIFWGFNALYIALSIRQFRRDRILNIGKWIVFLNTLVVYYGCLVLAENFWLWTVCLGLTHALPYVALTYQSAFHGKFAHHQFPKDRLAKILFASHLLYFPVLLVLALYLQHGPSTAPLLPFSIAEWFFPLVFLPTLLHYYLDTFIWRRPQTREGASAAHRSLVPVTN